MNRVDPVAGTSAVLQQLAVDRAAAQLDAAGLVGRDAQRQLVDPVEVDRVVVRPGTVRAGDHPVGVDALDVAARGHGHVAGLGVEELGLLDLREDQRGLRAGERVVAALAALVGVAGVDGVEDVLVGRVPAEGRGRVVPVRPRSGWVGWACSSWPRAGWMITSSPLIGAVLGSVTATSHDRSSPKSKNEPFGGSVKSTLGPGVADGDRHRRRAGLAVRVGHREPGVERAGRLVGVRRGRRSWRRRCRRRRSPTRRSARPSSGSVGAGAVELDGQRRRAGVLVDRDVGRRRARAGDVVDRGAGPSSGCRGRSRRPSRARTASRPGRTWSRSAPGTAPAAGTG